MADARGAERDRPATDEPPPVLGAWWRLYAVVLIALAAEIALFWGLTLALR